MNCDSVGVIGGDVLLADSFSAVQRHSERKNVSPWMSGTAVVVYWSSDTSFCSLPFKPYKSKPMSCRASSSWQASRVSLGNPSANYMWCAQLDRVSDQGLLTIGHS